MRKIMFESDPEFILACVLAGIAYGAIQYYRTKNQPWSRTLNWLLLLLRSVLATLLAFLLLGPIVKQIRNQYEKPYFIFVHDNSASIPQVIDSTKLQQLQRQMATLSTSLSENGYSPIVHDLKGKTDDAIQYNQSRSDISSSLKLIGNLYEGQNIGGVVLISDGIYNAGLSPAYSSYNFPIYTVGIGDTTERIDASVKHVAHNKIVYQGNKFPIRAEVQLKNIGGESINVSLLQRGKILDKQTRKIAGDNELLVFDFQPLASEQGIQKLDVQVDVVSGEQNVRNNRSSVFVEVVEGKKKILLVAPSPHPDIKAIRDVIQKNANYEFLLHIPGVQEQPAASLRPENIDLAIFHQSPDVRGRTSSLLQTLLNSRSSVMIMIGQQTDLSQLSRLAVPVKYEGVPREYDEVTPAVSPNFPHFAISTEATTAISGYPPAFVHFGKMKLSPTATTLLYQRIGSVTSDKPLLVVDVNDDRKIGMFLGEGSWRWKLNEYEKTETSQAFEELFGKLVQFLSTTEDKKKFRSYTLQQEFPDTDPVIFESQVYNDIYEPVYGNKIDIDVTDESGKRTEYTYVTSPGNIRYQIGGLQEGVYRFRSRTTINNKVEEVRGEFAVVKQDIELQNLTADFNLLRAIAKNTGGKFYDGEEVTELQRDLETRKAQAIIHTEESYDSMINLKWVFFLLLALVSIEWVIRKYHGSY